MPDDENYQINQHPWLVLTTITPLHQPRPRCHRHGVMLSVAHLGSPGLTQAVGAGGSLCGHNYIFPSPTFNPSLGTLSSQDSQAQHHTRIATHCLYPLLTTKF